MKIGLQTWGSEGDVQPFIALAAGLVQAGHVVTLLVTDNEGRDYSKYSEQFGFTLINVLGTEEMSPEVMEQLWRKMIGTRNLITQTEMILSFGFDPVMEQMFAAAKELCANNDLVVGHFFLHPLRAAAEKSATPIVTINLVHSLQPSAFLCPGGFPDFGSWSYPFAWKIVRVILNHIFLPRVNALRHREHLIPNTDVIQQSWVSERLNLIAVSPSIFHVPPDWEGTHSVCGFLNLPKGLPQAASPAGLEEFIAAGNPPVYFCFGSMMIHHLNYIQQTVALWNEAVKRVGCRAIFQLPWDDLSVFDCSTNVFKLQRSTHQIIFPRCALIVHHGGSGTTQASLRAGRPSVVVAHIADQFFWGAELQRLGVAGPKLIRKRLSAKCLAASIAKVLASPDMANRAAVIARAMAQENGVEVAVKLLEACISRPSSTSGLVTES
ncbi:glycosyltransferase [Undibacterium sp. RTI2.1]|uniref:glycosyltransferase n=1 Tax=unclassified Undibacterium TaxID=2630295 RepID=UPI002B221CED|nr:MULTISPECIES: glycosyltransferase [unclassified Undibacterium]MEB0032217.1 glycosyltransferase [Undibacterium sp. RTI2.1]MEB0117037.1 glycosyltransferase [Undibacterium sp. RTI2.2]